MHLRPVCSALSGRARQALVLIVSCTVIDAGVLISASDNCSPVPLTSPSHSPLPNHGLRHPGPGLGCASDFFFLFFFFVRVSFTFQSRPHECKTRLQINNRETIRSPRRAWRGDTPRPPGPGGHCVLPAPHLSAALNDITQKGISGVTQIYFCPQHCRIFS